MGRREPNPVPRLLHVLLANQKVKLTHEVLADEAGIGVSTIHSKVRELSKTRIFNAGTGRRLSIGPGLGLAIGVEVGHRSLRAGIFDPGGQPIEFGDASNEVGAVELQLTRPLLQGDRPILLRRMHPKAVLRAIRDIVAELMERVLGVKDLRTRDDEIRLIGIGVAVPATITSSGELIPGETLHPDWTTPSQAAGEDIAESIGAAVGLSMVSVESHCDADVRAAAYWTAIDHGPTAFDSNGPRVVLAVRADEQLTAAAIKLPPASSDRFSYLDGTLVAGGFNHAGRIDHLAVDPEWVSEFGASHGYTASALDPWTLQARTCGCGKGQHLGSFASLNAIRLRLQRSGYDVIDFESTPGSKDAKHAIEAAVWSAGRLTGRALSAPVLTLGATDVVISGPVAVSGFGAAAAAERSAWLAPPDGDILVNQMYPACTMHGAALGVVETLWDRLDGTYRQILDGSCSFTGNDLAEMRTRLA